MVITVADDSRSTFIHMVTWNPIPSESYETCAIVRAEGIVAERFNSPIICTRLALINLRTTIRFHGTPLSSCKCVSPWNWWKLRACYKYGSCIHQHPCTTIHLPWSLNYERNWNESSSGFVLQVTFPSQNGSWRQLKLVTGVGASVKERRDWSIIFIPKLKILNGRWTSFIISANCLETIH